jgi:multiple sugar transport system substrate-binding protein
LNVKLFKVMKNISIICWKHRRAVDPLLAAVKEYQAQHPDVAIRVDERPLSDFEHQGIAGVAHQYDIIIFDHPFCGDIAEGEYFLPLDTYLPQLFGPQADPYYVGPSLATYRYSGHVWGAPIDAATQHAIVRTDLMAAAGESVPSTWDEVIALGERLRAKNLKLGFGVETPHALCLIAALMANEGYAWHNQEGQDLYIDRAAFKRNLQRVRQLLTFCPPEAVGWNSIDIHQQMIQRDDIAYTPCVYGYATYGESDMRKPLGFGPFPGVQAPFYAGTAIGGTAMGISRYAQEQETALDFVAFYVSPHVQEVLIPENHGQGATESSWTRKKNDEIFNGFYSATKETIDHVWVRPRMAGYPIFQQRAADVVCATLRGLVDEEHAIDEVMRLVDALNARTLSSVHN